MAEASSQMTAIRIPKYLYTLLYITLGSGAVVVGFFIAGEHASGWHSLTYAIYGMSTVALWVLVCVTYAIWVLIRDGRHISSIPALVIVLVALALGTIWFLGDFR